MAIKSISQISRERGIPTSTLRAAAERGRFEASKSGGTWLADDESLSYQKWEEERPLPGRGRKKNSNTGGDEDKNGDNNDSRLETSGGNSAGKGEGGVIISLPPGSGSSSNQKTTGTTGGEGESTKRMYKIAIGLQKGGVGKTSTTLCLGAGLVLAGKKVLLVDMDAQGNLTTASGVDKFEVTPLYQALVDPVGMRLADLVVRTQYGYDLLPNNILMDKLPMQLAAEMGRERRLVRKLKELETGGQLYDYILFDLPPTLGLATGLALTASDGVLIPVQCDEFALEGLADFIDTINLVQEETNPHLTIFKVILTMYSSQTVVSRNVTNEVKNQLGELVSPTVIKFTTAMKELATRGPIQSYAPRHEVAVAYNRLAKEVIDATPLH